MKKYSFTQLADATPKQSSEWLDKYVKIVCTNGNVIEGKVVRVDRNAKPLNCSIPAEERLFTGLKLDNNEYVGLGNIETMEIEE